MMTVNEHVKVAKKSACILVAACVALTGDCGTEEICDSFEKHNLVMLSSMQDEVGFMLVAFPPACRCRINLVMRSRRGGLPKAAILSSLEDAKAVTLEDLP